MSNAHLGKLVGVDGKQPYSIKRMGGMVHAQQGIMTSSIPAYMYVRIRTYKT
jgi:hypothetical protein